MKRESHKKVLAIPLVAFVILAIIPPLTTSVNGATDEEMEASGAAAVAYLASKQDSDKNSSYYGSWGQEGDWVAKTGLVLLKFLARAQELNKDPFDNDTLSPTHYEYANNVIAGFDYLLGTAQAISISAQTHGNPDTNGNGMGIVFGNAISGLHVYNTGIALTALAFSRHPDDRSAGIGTLGLLTYREIAQDVADWLYFAQGDLGDARGGFNYDALDNSSGRTDNSNGGYAYLGLAFAEDLPFSCTVPQWVRDELNIYIDYIQNDVDGDADDGGSGYTGPDEMVNILKTGNLIFEMAFYGDTPCTPRVQDAVDYLERHWQDENMDPGWGYSQPVANYQAKFLVEKGLTYMGIGKIDTDDDGQADDDWFNQESPANPLQDFASVIVAQQLPDGSWPQSGYDGYSDAILSTAWAVLTLERFAPIPIDGEVSRCGSGHSGAGVFVWSFVPQIEITEAGPFILDEPNTVYKLMVDLKVARNDFYYFNIAADGVTLDFRGHTITGSSGYFGVICDGRKDITITLGRIEGFDIGIVVCDSDVNIKNVEITGMFKILRTTKSGLFSALVHTLISENSQ